MTDNLSEIVDNSKPVVVGLSIKSGEHSTILVTPSGKYGMYDGRVVQVEPVTNYAAAVQMELDMIKRRAMSGLWTEEHYIQFFGKTPDLSDPKKIISSA